LKKKSGMATATVLWDSTKLFDSLELWLLGPGPHGHSVRFPGQAVLSWDPHPPGHQVFEARAMLVFTHRAGQKHPTRVCAKRSVDKARAVLYDLIEDLHARYRPTTFKVWVDDVLRAPSGRRAEVAGRNMQGARALVSGLQELG
jgi:hypothetical protein